MKTINIKIIFALLTMILSTLACNYFNRQAPTPFAFPEPNLTLTALFGATSVFPSSTPLPIIVQTNTPVSVSPTMEPSPTEEIPTATNSPEPPPPTKTPTVSYEGPDKRSGVSVEATYMKNAPTIDGVFDEWNFERDDIIYPVYGKSEISSSGDLSGNFMAGWDEDYLYLAVRVKDDKYKQNASRENIFKGDSLEILWDANVSGDFYYKGLNNDDYQLGISPGSPQPGDDPEAYLWYPSSRAGNYNEVKIGATPTDNGYRVEVKIPWSLFKTKPAKGEHFGFCMSISDNDKSGANVQQSMVSNVSTRTLTDPTTWGDIQLIKP